MRPGQCATALSADDLFKSMPSDIFAALCEREGPRITEEIERAMADASKLFEYPPPMLPMPRWP